MALKAIWKRTFLSALDNNSTVNFDFGQAVTPAMFGLSGFSLSYKDGKGHNVGTMKVTASVGTSTSGVVPLTLTPLMIDNGGNKPDPNSSYVDYTVLGWTGDNPGLVSIGTGGLQSSGTQYTPSDIPTTVNAKAAVLGGFDVQYGDGDHQVLKVNASAKMNGTNVDLVANMNDNGHNTANGQAIGGAILTGVTNPGFAILTITGKHTDDTTSVDFTSLMPAGSSLIGCAAMLSAFTCSYQSGDAHDINTIRIGAQGDNHPTGVADGQPYYQGNKVYIQGPSAKMWDDGGWPSSNHTQDNNMSTVDLVVIGIYA